MAVDRSAAGVRVFFTARSTASFQILSLTACVPYLQIWLLQLIRIWFERERSAQPGRFYRFQTGICDSCLDEKFSHSLDVTDKCQIMFVCWLLTSCVSEKS